MMNLNEFSNEIIKIINKTNKGVLNNPITNEVNLITSGLIDSFVFSELILYLEEWTNNQISIEEIEIEAFNYLPDMYEIYKHYYKEL